MSPSLRRKSFAAHVLFQCLGFSESIRFYKLTLWFFSFLAFPSPIHFITSSFVFPKTDSQINHLPLGPPAVCHWRRPCWAISFSIQCLSPPPPPQLQASSTLTRTTGPSLLSTPLFYSRTQVLETLPTSFKPPTFPSSPSTIPPRVPEFQISEGTGSTLLTCIIDTTYLNMSCLPTSPTSFTNTITIFIFPF